MAAGLKSSRITPLLGEAFLASAITAGKPCANLSCMALVKPRGAIGPLRLALILSFRSSIEVCCWRWATSSSLRETMRLSTVGVFIKN